MDAVRYENSLRIVRDLLERNVGRRLKLVECKGPTLDLRADNVVLYDAIITADTEEALRAVQDAHELTRTTGRKVGLILEYVSEGR